MKGTEKFADETRNRFQNRAVSDGTGKCPKTTAWKEFTDMQMGESGNSTGICDDFRIIGRQRDLYRERCIRLQKENEDLRRMLHKIQIMVCQYSNG